ncbi:MAG: hypothetical protein ACRDH8_13535 [Actinomycetota bacterium]
MSSETATSSRSGSGRSASQTRAALLWLPLVAVTVAAVVAAQAGALPRWPGLVQAVAVPPLDLFFDLRVLVARATSYPIFALGVVVSVVVRSAVLAALVGAVGGSGSLLSLWRRCIRWYGWAVVPVGIAAALQYAGLAAVYAWYWWTGFVLLLLVVPFFLGSVAGASGRTLGGRFRLGATVATLVAYGSLGALARAVGPGATVVLVPVSAAVTAVLLLWMGGRLRIPRRKAPVGVAAGIVLLGLVSPPAVSPGPASGDAVLFLVPGVDTSSGSGSLYGLDPEEIGFPCDRVYYYSYRGPGRGADRADAVCPIRIHAPYTKQETQRSLDRLTEAFVEQLGAIREASGGAAVVVVTHSQGAVIAWRAASVGGAEGISHLVALAGFPRTSAPYPPPGEEGEGLVGGDMLRFLSAATRRFTDGTFDPDAPLAREVLAPAGGLDRIFAQGLPPEVTAAIVFATLDEAVAPLGHRAPGAASGGTVDTTHTGITESEDAYDAVRRVLEGLPPPGAGSIASVLRSVLPGWGPPPNAPTG